MLHSIPRLMVSARGSRPSLASKQQPRVLRIGLLLYARCLPAGLFAFADLLAAANARAGRHRFDIVWVAQTLAPVPCAQGMSLMPQELLRDASLDAVLIPGSWATSHEALEAAMVAQQSLLPLLAQLHGRGVALWSYCTGVMLLAQAGVLDQQPATATWWLARRLEQQFPKVRWQFQHSCITNQRGRSMTASGVNGYLPMAQVLIEQQLGDVAYDEVRRLMVLPRPEPVLPIFQTVSLMEQPSALLRQFHLLVEQMPFGQATASNLAQAMALSPRTLARRVQEGGQCTVAHYVRLIKLRQASEQLLLTQASIAQISDRLGFGDESNFRRLFKRVTGYTPTNFRSRFQS
jgi:transcriptional regulator GlxA family with amidase domain